MRTRPKDLGTRAETSFVRRAQSHGLHAERLPEGGSADRGDVRILTDYEWVGEVKDRMQLNLHQTLERAVLKAGHRDVFVVWRKMVRADGSERRRQDGPILVALELDRFLELLGETV